MTTKTSHLKLNQFTRGGLALFVCLTINACAMDSKQNSETVFQQAKLQFEGQDGAPVKAQAGLMPSYYLAIPLDEEIDSNKIVNSQKLDELIASISHPEEYQLQITTGLNGSDNPLQTATIAFKQASLLKRKYNHRFKNVETAVLKNQSNKFIYVRMVA